MGARSSISLGTAAAVFAPSFSLLAIANLFGIHWLDEAYQLYPAWRLNEGDVLYRDVFVLTPPLHYYLLAGAERLLGPGLLYGRLVSAALGAAKTTLVFAIARRLMGSRPAAIAAALTLVCLELPLVLPSYTKTAMLWLLLAVHLQLVDTSKRRRFLVGACVGLAIWSKQDVGFAAAVAMLWLPRPGLRARRELALGILTVGGLGLALAWGIGFLGPMLTVLLRDAPVAKGPRLLEWVARVLPMVAYWAAFLVAVRVKKPSAPVFRLALAGWIALHTLVCVVLTVGEHPLPYGIVYGLYTALFFAGHGLVIGKLAARENRAARPLALASATVFAVTLLGGTGLPHILGAMPLGLVPLACVWIDRPSLRSLLAGLGVCGLLLGLGLRAEAWHYAFAGFPRMADCDSRYAGVLLPAEDAHSLRRLERLLQDAARSEADPLDMISFPSPLPNVLVGLPSPLRRFTFYRETQPELGARPRIVLVHDPLRRGRDDLPPRLRRAFPDFVRARSLGRFHLYVAASDLPLASRLRRGNPDAEPR